MRVRLKQERLLEMLAQSSLSQNHWAIKLGISRGHWSEIVNGKHPYPSPKTRERLLEVFKVEFDELFAIESGPAGVSDATFQAAIADRYLIEKELGHGAMGTVYLARDLKHGRLVAVKVVAPEAVSGIGIDKFLQEIRHTASLEHHHILGLYDSGQAAGFPFYVMPYIRGGSLRERLQRDRSLSIAETLKIARGVAAALTYAHRRQMLHCDVKPENILLSDDHAYVADFGIARAIRTEVFEWGERREIDASAGTPAYVSPEQATGERNLDGRSDVYSLGCMVFEMLSGAQPFTGTSTMDVVSKRFRKTVPDLRHDAPHISRALAGAVARAMQLDPSDRTDTPKDFIADLERSASRRSWPALERVGRLASSIWSIGRSILGLKGKTKRGALLDSIRQDMHHAGRSLMRKPGFTAAAVVTLGLGIGATTSIFSVVNSVLLRPLPYEDPGHLVVLNYRPLDQATRAVWAAYDDYISRHMRVSSTYPNFERWRQSTDDVFDELGVYDDSWTYAVNLGAGTEILPGTLVSAGLLRALGVRPVVGRWFVDADDAPEAPATILLSYGLWQRRFGGDPKVVGRSISVRERPYTVVGVMPREFMFPSASAQFWMPLAWATRGNRSWNYQVVGRVRQGLSMQRAQALLEARAIEVERKNSSRATFGASFESLRRYLVGDARSVLLIFMAAVTSVLLIACVNVVNLMLARATGREHEYTVRAAIGAGPKRLAQYLFTESAMVSLLGAALGLALAAVLVKVMVALAPGSIPRQQEIGIDGRVLAFTLAICVVVAIGIAVMPAIRASKIDLTNGLNEASRGASAGRRHGRIRDGLVMAQLALALILLIAGGLLLRSFMSLLAIETGIRPRHVLTFETALPSSRYQTFADGRRFYDELLRQVRALPGVRSAALVVYLPVGSEFHTTDFEVGDYAATVGEQLEAEEKQISPGYFTTMGIPLLSGRGFSASDDESAAPVIVINQYMARRYWEDGAAIGGRVMLDSVWHTVVGVVSDVRYRGAGMEGRHPHGSLIYRAYAAGSRGGSMDVVMNVNGDPASVVPSIRRVVTQLDPDVALYGIRPLENRLWDAVSEPRFRMLLLGVFGIASLLLSVVGVYGVMAYAVAQRTHELGIRKALGANGGRILLHVVSRGATLTVVGLALGTLGALATVGVLQEYLYGLAPRDPWTFAGAIAILGTVSLLACWIPARAATRVDPLIALRVE